MREKNEQSEENVLLSEEKDEEDGGGRVGVGGNFVSDLLVNTYKQAQEAEEMLLRTKRESLLNQLENWTTSTTAAAATTTTTTTNRVLDFDDIGNEKNLNNNSNNNMNNNTNFSSAKMNADGQVGVTERYASYLAKVLPSGKRRNSQKKNNTFDFGPDNNDNDDDDDDDKQFEKVKSTFMSDHGSSAT